MPFSRWDVMASVHDKRAQMEAAWRAGVDTPKTVFVSSGAELEAAAGEIRFPAVLKPVESLAFKLRFHRHILDVETPAELQRIYDKVDDLGVLILQERIPGGEDELWTVGSYLDAESRPLAVFTGHKLRQYPHAGGSCLAGVSRWDDKLADAALRLLQELHFHGVSQVEFKRDPRDGRFCLMEINARHWKWHGLAARCGVNLSYAAYRDAIGDPYIARRQQGRRQVDRGQQGRAAGAAGDREAPAQRTRVRALAARHAHGRPARVRRPAARPAERRHGGEAGPDAGAAREGRRSERGPRVTPPELTVFVGAPEAFAPRAEWALRTLLAPLGRRAAVTRDPAQASGAALAYAAEPVAGVPTIPCDAGAMELLAAGRPLPAGAFAARGSGDGGAVAAWPAGPDAGFAVPFDLVASAFVLLACWDEYTTDERDKYGRLPFSASVFAANPELQIDEPAVDRYVELLRGALAPRLAELGLEPLPPAGSLWGARGRFAIALTHDLDNLWRWTRRGFAAAGYRTARAARHLEGRAVLRELGDGADWLVRHLPRRTDPFWTFPLHPGRRGPARRLLDLLRDRPPHAQAGRQPAGDVPAPDPRGARAGHRRRARGRPARQRRRPARPRRGRPRPPRAVGARRPRRHRHPLSLPAGALPRDAAAARTGRLHLRHHHGLRRARGLPLRLLVPVPPLLAWRRSGPSTSSSCRLP